MKAPLYPLKFIPLYKERLWGGQKLMSYLNKDFGDLDKCGESWEISGVEGDISVVSSGELRGQSLQELIRVYTEDLVGGKIFKEYNDEFPLLIKFIDANDDLSVQVHPDDKLAWKKHRSKGKAEMWYIVKAEKNATLISGFSKKTNRNDFLEKFENGEINNLVNKEQVAAGDFFFIPAGRIHTIGKGILLAEIQQASDITYRIYDFDRVDKHGQSRELHLEESVDALDYDFYENYKGQYVHKKNEAVNLAKCQYFTTNKISATQPITRDYSSLDSFVIYICVEGQLKFEYQNHQYSMRMGETILIPACINELMLVPDETFAIIETYIE